MSTRGLRADTTIDDYDLDTEAIIEGVGAGPVVLFAFGTRGHNAIRYAVKHPDNVKAIIWQSAAVQASAWPASMWVDLPAENWKLFLQSVAPRDVDQEEFRRVVREYERCIDLEDWNIRNRVNRPSDIENELRRLRQPLLVTRTRRVLTLPPEEAVRVVALAPDARLVLLDGISVTGDPNQMLAAIDSFMAELPAAPEAAPGSTKSGPQDGLSQRELEVLRLLAVGKSNQQIADELVISLNTARKHVANILDKTSTANRTEAAGYARDHGLT
jgi:DNA-binding CsgD family transcriptional regulator/pimeloyl-ACP methyl ester carboxylesterase